MGAWNSATKKLVHGFANGVLMREAMWEGESKRTCGECRKKTDARLCGYNCITEHFSC